MSLLDKKYTTSQPPAPELKEPGEKELERIKIQQLIKGIPQQVSYQTGELVPDKGIYLCTWSPTNEEGITLNRKYNIFVAPENMSVSKESKTEFTFKEAAKELGRLKNWNGHDGIAFKNDDELFETFSGNKYKGQWFIPPGEILFGLDRKGRTTNENNMFRRKNIGAFKGTYPKAYYDKNANSYWSSTYTPFFKNKEKETRIVQCKNILNRVTPKFVRAINFVDGSLTLHLKSDQRLSCRLIRAEPA